MAYSSKHTNAPVVSFFGVTASGTKNTVIKPRGSGRKHDSIAWQVVVTAFTGAPEWVIQGREDGSAPWKNMPDTTVVTTSNDGIVRFEGQFLPQMRIRQRVGGITFTADYHLAYNGGA